MKRWIVGFLLLCGGGWCVTPFLIPPPCGGIGPLCGEWSLANDNDLCFRINDNEVVCQNRIQKSEVAMVPRVITTTEGTIRRIHLHTLSLRSRPDRVSWSAISWVNKILRHGIDIDILSFNETDMKVQWKICRNEGTCKLTRNKMSELDIT